MKLPNKFRFMSTTWEIKDNGVGRMPDVGNRKHMGRANFKKHIIHLNKKMPRSVICNTLLHEIIHIIVDMQGIKEAQEEHVVEGITNGIMEAFQQNDWFGKFFSEEL